MEEGKAVSYTHLDVYKRQRYDGGVPLLALKGKAPTIPATVVLDAQGRIAARILGPVTEATLGGVVDDALKELR